MSRFHAFVQACIFTIFMIMAVCAFFFGYIWRGGFLGPEESEDAINALLATIGPWAFAIDVFIISPLLWWFTRSTIWKPKTKILKGLIMDDKPIPIIPPPAEYPVFLPPPYDPEPDPKIWDEMSRR